MRVFEAMARGLVDEGVSVVFGLLGEGNLYIGVAMEDVAAIEFVSVAHEASAVMMACGYAEVTSQVGVATVTHGPGLTNAITGLVHASRAHIPIVVICGETPRNDLQNLQRLDQQATVSVTGAAFVSVRAPETAVQDLMRAFRLARVRRGPVVLNVPTDFQWDSVEYERPDSFPMQLNSGADPAALDEALGSLVAARRPLILAGRGAVGARSELVELSERLGAPLATTLLAKGLFTGHPNDVGVFGSLSWPRAVDVIVDADVVFVIGASLNTYTTMDGALLAGKQIIHCDDDPESIGQWESVQVGIIGDSHLVVSAMNGMLSEADVVPSTFIDGNKMDLVRQFDPLASFEDASTPENIDPRTAMVRLDEALPTPRIFVTDAGRFVDHALRYFTPSEPGGLIHTLAFGSIGLGMGAAVGAAFGRKGEPVVALVGDGAFMMAGLSEFHLAVRENLDLVVVVFNDHAYGAEHTHLHHHGLDTRIIEFTWPDFAMLATAVGGTGVTVRTLQDLEDAIEIIRERSRPVLLDVISDPSVLSMSE